MINRSALIVRPKQPYVDWAKGLDDSGMDPSEIGERTVYLLPEYDDDIEGLALLSKGYEHIFEAELEGWHLIEDDWPANRTFAMFCEWFDIELHSMVVDMVDGPIVDDDL